MLFKRITAGLSAAALAGTMAAAGALTCYADEITADENGVYGQAGIAWMIMDLWEYRRGIEEPSLDEAGTNEVSGTYHDVNITGNGQYTVDMSGYYPSDDIDYAVGYFGLYTTMQVEEEGDVVITLDETVIDGVTYTFTESPLPEDSELDGKILKIKNGYGACALTEPEMDIMAWKTTDTISITFTVSGLPTDKIEDNPDETFEQVYGNGSKENDAAAEEETETDEAEDTTDGTDETAESAEETSESAAETAQSVTSSDSAAEESDGAPIGLIIGIVAGVVVVVVIVVVAVKKK